MADAEKISLMDLAKVLNEATGKVKTKLEELKGNDDNMSIEAMFEMQMLMNNLSQLSEMATSVASASHSAVMSAARNVKS